MIENLTVSNCAANKSVAVSWTINQTFPDDVINVTYIQNYGRSNMLWEFSKVSNDWFSKSFHNFCLYLFPTSYLLTACFKEIIGNLASWQNPPQGLYEVTKK